MPIEDVKLRTASSLASSCILSHSRFEARWWGAGLHPEEGIQSSTGSDLLPLPGEAKAQLCQDQASQTVYSSSQRDQTGAGEPIASEGALSTTDKSNIPSPFDLLKSSSSRLMSCSFQATLPLRIEVRPFVVGGLQCLSAVIAFVVTGCLACRRVLGATETYNRSGPASPHQSIRSKSRDRTVWS